MLIIWYGSALFLGFAGLTLGAMWLWWWSRQWRGIRRPVREKMLRPPGNSLREQLEKLDEDFMGPFLFAVVLPAIIPIFIAARPVLLRPIGAREAWLGLILGLAAWLPSCYGLLRVLRKRSDHFLGYQGEVAVAESLQELARLGCYVFHDLQPDKLQRDKRWNIDHLVVAPDSVLVVETKTRRKRSRTDDRAAHEVIFDGRVLHFPGWSDTHGLEQAERNAGWVRDYLSKALAEPVKVEPVLALPGWWVRRKGRGQVYVVNPKEVRALVRGRGGQMISPEKAKRMRQIAHALEQKCRDVEF
jgi:hypothetical protein